MLNWWLGRRVAFYSTLQRWAALRRSALLDGGRMRRLRSMERQREEMLDLIHDYGVERLREVLRQKGEPV
jgi:hypothetical protein